MPEEELYRTIGNIEAKIDSITEILKDHTSSSNETEKDVEKRLQAVELVIGKISIKLAIIGIAGVAALTKLVDFFWDKLTN
jgi:hypothetical protein